MSLNKEKYLLPGDSFEKWEEILKKSLRTVLVGGEGCVIITVILFFLFYKPKGKDNFENSICFSLFPPNHVPTSSPY